MKNPLPVDSKKTVVLQKPWCINQSIP